MTTNPNFSEDIQTLADLNTSGMHIIIHPLFHRLLQNAGININNSIATEDLSPWTFLKYQGKYETQVSSAHTAFIVGRNTEQVFANTVSNTVNGRKYFYEVRGLFEFMYTFHMSPISSPYFQNLEMILMSLDSIGINEYKLNKYKSLLSTGNSVAMEEKGDRNVTSTDNRTLLWILVVGGLIGFAVLIVEILYSAFNKKSQKEKRVQIITVQPL